MEIGREEVCMDACRYRENFYLWQNAFFTRKQVFIQERNLFFIVSGQRLSAVHCIAHSGPLNFIVIETWSYISFPLNRNVQNIFLPNSIFL